MAVARSYVRTRIAEIIVIVPVDGARPTFGASSTQQSPDAASCVHTCDVAGVTRKKHVVAHVENAKTMAQPSVGLRAFERGPCRIVASPRDSALP
jgi:hypothetical protein